MILGLISFFFSQLSLAGTTQPPLEVKSSVVQIRAYQLKPDSQEIFHDLVVNKGLPLLKRWDINVVAFGPSSNSKNGYFLVRAFENVADFETKDHNFYTSEEWKQGPRADILALIEDYSTLVIAGDSLSNYSIETLTLQQMDMEVLSKLNDQFIKNFVNQDVGAHEKIIHSDFICINGDGTISNRDEYMKGWASGYSRSGYTSFSITDENIRIFGKMALVRSKTVYTKETDGQKISGNSLYTDTYIKENGEWKCIQAHITPVLKK